MLALAQFAAGVAHDLNNQLTGVLGFAAVLGRSVDGAAGQGHLAELRTAAEKAAALARDMQAFGRRPTSRPKGLDLVAAVLGALDGARHLMPHGVTLTSDTTGAVEGRADANLLTQGLMDLLPQLALATASGGAVTVSVVDGSEPTIRAVARPALITADLLLRRCRPYAEPKSQHGNGLALAAAWAALHHAGGRLGFRDEAGGLMAEIAFARPTPPA